MHVATDLPHSASDAEGQLCLESSLDAYLSPGQVC